MARDGTGHSQVVCCRLIVPVVHSSLWSHSWVPFCRPSRPFVVFCCCWKPSWSIIWQPHPWLDHELEGCLAHVSKIHLGLEGDLCVWHQPGSRVEVMGVQFWACERFSFLAGLALLARLVFSATKYFNFYINLWCNCFCFVIVGYPGSLVELGTFKNRLNK